VGLLVKECRVLASARPPSPPTAVVTMKAQLFLDLLAGRSDVSTAQLTGRIRVEGEGHAFLIVSGLISQFRAAAVAPGLRGHAGRLAQRFIAGPTSPAPRSAT
jgi:putative sterol carrier protein